jgi:prepilin-type N-terminal cleavage/methylation domain-containing protein
VKNVQFKKIIRAKKGFTLIEVICAMVIAALVIGLSGSYFISSMNLFGHIESTAEQKEIADMTADFIKERLLYAKNISVVEAAAPPAATGGKQVLFIGDQSGTATANQGYLFFMREDDTVPMNVYGKAHYKQFRISLDFDVRAEDGQNKVFAVNVYTCADGQRGYSDKKTFELVNSHEDDAPEASVTISGADKKYYLIFDLPESAERAG